MAETIIPVENSIVATDQNAKYEQSISILDDVNLAEGS